MKIINQKENQIIFSVEAKESLLNAIRKYLNQIPILAVDEVEIAKNDSALYDETIAHRVGLIPLKMNDKDSNEKLTCILKLESKKEGFVYSEELNGKAKAVYGKIPITFLGKDQELNFTATVRAGKGKEHSRFSPGLMFYRNVADIKIDKECPPDTVKICPKNVLGNKDGKVVVEDNFLCDMCEACVDICRKNGKDSIKLSPSEEMVVTIESFGQMDKKDIFRKSVEVLKADLKEIDKKLK